VRHGSIKGFSNGINTLFGVTSFTRACAFRDLVVSGCTSQGIFAGDGAVIESCRAHDNSGASGITVSAGASLTNCTASFNTVTDGIHVGGGATLLNCSAFSNTATYGINAGNGSTLTNCAASENNGPSASPSGGINTGTGCTINHCAGVENTSSTGSSQSTNGVGFNVGQGSIIQSCTAASNQGDGIRMSTLVVARQNSCFSNGSNGDGAGIHATLNHNRIEANYVANNDRGIDVDFAANVIIMNTATTNGTNYDIVANNVFGAIVDRTAPASGAVSGSSAASSAATTDPWANFSY
jgi:hypothetical protein